MTEHELPKTRSGEPRAFFGRRSGKKLHGGQKAQVAEILPRFEIALAEQLDPRALFPEADRIVIEIGYGGGEHLARKAAEQPGTGFIGCEVFTGGIGKMVQAIEANDLENVRLYTDDALKLLMTLPEASVDEVYLLYPDPWPKTRHHKRRFVSPTTLDQLARVIRPGGVFNFATDIEDYADWTLAHILRQPSFIFAPQAPGSWHTPYPGWQPTRYERKARREGRMLSFYFSFPRQAV
ncbi:tRNA (guanosine(46)-N7)-methyltransferase TrmB [Devosia indica]|uniref:tRNA (guanosine(46)-N7)-methyltransferase TrmB n=1 Tax=Devosia indica TaxID=2079253 RepID=UPI00268020E0